MNRRDLLRALAGAGALGALGACSSSPTAGSPTTSTTSTPSTTTETVAPTSSDAPAVAESGPAGSTVDPSTVPPAPSTAVGAVPETVWSPGTPATYVDHGDPGSALVALTFHFAGDPALAARLLDLLSGNSVRSTLFAIGDWLTAHPALGHRALADGHELGNHTKSHQPMLDLDRAHVHAEIQGGGNALMPFVGSIGNWFRPSGTDVPTPLILEEAGRVGYPVSVGYDIDSRDFTNPGPQTVIDNVTPHLHPGAIVSLHFGHRDTLTALPPILEQIAALGLRTATITELLAHAPGT